MRVLVVNVGSSSVKLRLLDGDDALLDSRDLEGGLDAEGERVLADLGSNAEAVGHRVVHGGDRIAAERVDGDVLERLRGLTGLAPLHQPPALHGIESATRLLPSVPQVACFDTAFHATLPAAARTYALPRDWRERLGVRRYGFHGLSHAWVARRAAAMVGEGASSRLLSCHLGAGASLAAVRDGVCVDTTMGFTPLEGLVMATRSGSVDPGALLWLLRDAGLSADEVWDALEHRSGLAGLAGTADMREVHARAAAGDEGATLALDVHAHRLAQCAAGMAVSLGGLDCVAFTGGIGEHDGQARGEAARRLGFLGVSVDPAGNAAAVPDVEITAAGARVRVLVVEAREDLEIARQVRQALA